MNKSSKITASELVLSTIFFLQQKSGVTAKDITKFICEKRGCRQSQVRSEVKKALERATENGIFSKKRGLYRIESGFGRNKISIKVKGSGKSKKMRRVKRPSSTRTAEMLPCDHVSGSVYKASVLSTPSNLSDLKHFCSKGNHCRGACVMMLGEGHIRSSTSVKRVSLEHFKARKTNTGDDDDDDDEDFLEEDEDEDDDIDYFADDQFPNANDALKDYEEPEKRNTPEKPEKRKPGPKRKAQSRSKSRNKGRGKKRKMAKPKRKPCKRKRPPPRRSNKREKALPDSAEDSKPLEEIKTEQQEVRDECELGGDSQQERMEEDELPGYEEHQSLENENNTPALSENDYENETENDEYDYGPDYGDDQENEDYDYGGDDYGSGEDYQGQDEDPQENKKDGSDENKEESVKKMEEALQKQKIPVAVTTNGDRSSVLNSNDKADSRMSEDGKTTTVQQERQTYKERPSKRNRSSSLFRSCKKKPDSRIGCTTDRKQVRSRM